MWLLWVLVSFSILEGTRLQKCPEVQEILHFEKRNQVRQIYLQKSVVDKKNRIKNIKHERVRLKTMGILAPWLKFSGYDIRHKCILLESELLSLEMRIKNDIKSLNEFLNNP